VYADKTKNVIHAEILSNISDNYDKTAGNPVYNITEATSIELGNIYSDLDEVVEKIDIDNLTGTELEQRVNGKTGLNRKTATKATSQLSVTGTGTITIGDIFETASGIQYLSAETKVITTSGIVNIECNQYGSVGNVPANQIIYMPITITGITAVNNASAVTNGYDAETDKELLDRYYEKIKTPATSGNKAQFKNWAKEITGVGDAKIFPLWNGNNTVKVVIINSNKQPASTDLVTTVQTYIDPEITGLGNGCAMIGCYCTVVSATSKSITVSFSATIDTNYTTEQVQANVENSITEYFKDIAFVENYVSYAKIGSLVLGSAGVLDYTNLLVNSGTANITIADTEVAILGGVTIA
jgi:uncharacterized phage protein gp47/JayE